MTYNPDHWKEKAEQLEKASWEKLIDDCCTLMGTCGELYGANKELKSALSASESANAELRAECERMREREAQIEKVLDIPTSAMLTSPEYTEEIDDLGDLFTANDFVEQCNERSLVDYDGHGHPVKDGKLEPRICVKPSRVHVCLPPDATHVIWYNR